MFGIRRKNRLVYSTELGHSVRSLPPLYNINKATNYIALPAVDIPTLAEKYCIAMETEESAAWCRCEWVIHPDDTEVKAGTCRECGEPQKTHWKLDDPPEGRKHYGGYMGKRMRRREEAPDCPVHTKEGMLIYFFEWVFKDD